MKAFLNPVDLDLKHVRVIVQGMLRVAHSDGIHARELALISDFYESCRKDTQGLTELTGLAATAFDPEGAREAINTAQLQFTFLVSCYLVAYADGVVSEPEAKSIAELVRDLNIPAAVADEARELVKDQLLMKLARSANLNALKDIASKL
jgi:hypothetical protein